MATPHPSRCTCDLPGRAGGGESTCRFPSHAPYRLHYTSQDVEAGGGALPTWSVYVEQYPHDQRDGEPIDGRTRLVSTWPTEQAADREANRLQVLEPTLPCPRCGDTADRDGCDFCAGTGRVGSTIARAVGRTS